MTDSDFLKNSKTLLRKIVKQRKWLVSNNKSKISQAFACQEIRNLENAISTIRDTKTMKSYLIRKYHFLCLLISSKNKSYRVKLRQLIES